MKKYVTAFVVMVSAAGTAAADRPSWCKKDYSLSDYDVKSGLSETESKPKARFLARAACSSSATVQAKQADIDAARTKFATDFGFQDAEWTEAQDFDDGPAGAGMMLPSVHVSDFSSKNFAALTPLEQFSTISMDANFQNTSEQAAGSPIYFADMFGPHLSELGRVAFVGSCLRQMNDHDDATVTVAAICQEDFDKLDPAKAFADIRGLTIDPLQKLSLRELVHNEVASLAKVPTLTAHFIKKDDEYKRVLDIAAAARADWEKTIGVKTDLLDLALRSESAYLFQSRKMADGCDVATTKALQAAVSKIPAKAFQGAHDVREKQSFGHMAVSAFVNNGEVFLAGTAYYECRPTSGIGKYMNGVFGSVPGLRGPRTAALTALAGTTFKFDDASKKQLSMPRSYTGIIPPYQEHYEESRGGVLKSFKPAAKMTTLSFEPTMVKEENCLAEHQGNHILRILQNGTFQYEMLCDKWGFVMENHSWSDFDVTSDSAKELKPGVVVSAMSGNAAGYQADGNDVLAIWPSKNATLPSIVLGAHVK